MYMWMCVCIHIYKTNAWIFTHVCKYMYDINQSAQQMLTYIWICVCIHILQKHA